ncbi:uncharacterized protein LOC134235830 [Saccostrea cucullata]|uniref:uncharacterized protein LOC134235830 n=1 Tax=Saccostrea cuccullata TaxID=36930 RepID=UPI002ED45709
MFKSCFSRQFTNSKRTPEECRKKYNNAKQRTKEKIDFLKKECRKTGGGQGAEVELSEAEEVLLQRQDGRPSIFGLEAGFDSDIVVLTTDNKECEKSQDVASAPQTETSKDKESRGTTCSKVSEKKKIDERKENILEDSKRIRLEQRKLELEMIKIEKEIKLIDTKQRFYDMKLSLSEP